MSQPATDFAFTDRDFRQVVQLIRARAGIDLADSKRHMVYGRLGRRLRALGLATFADYLALLDDPDSPEWEAFTNSLTTNLTAFYREPHHFEILAQHLRRLRGRERYTIWCCAASTGEEPYTIAMTAVEVFDSFLAPVRVLATDLDTGVLATASAGVYTEDRVATLDEAQRRRFFLRGNGPNAGRVKVRAPLQQLITFRPLNLLAPDWKVRGPLDAIFCRNVMIYFDKPTQRQILQRMRPLLRPDGLLFAGHSESFLHSADLFSSIGRTVYRPAAVGQVAA